MILSEVDKAWLAGFIDGEGCISIYHLSRDNGNHHTWNHRITITNTRRDILENIRQMVGPGSCFSQVARRSSSTCKEAWAVTWYGQKAADLLDQVYPYLRLKKLHAETWMRFQKLINKSRVKISEEETSERFKIYFELKTLNRKGPAVA